MKKSAVFAALFLLFACWVSADVSVVILQGEAVGGQQAALTVSAVDEAGKPVKNLSHNNFELVVSGEKIDNFNVQPTSVSDEPLSIILGVDVSGSMRGKPFEETQKAISIFLDQLEKEDFVSLLSFGTKVGFVTDFTRDRYALRSQVEILRSVDNWTHLYDATYETIKKGKNAPTTRATVILLTDGRDEGSERQRKDAIDMASIASIPVFTIGIGKNLDSEFLQEIARVSGGDFVSTPEPEKIPELYKNVLDQLKNQYLIRFPFDKAPSTYKAVLTLTHGPEKAKTSKEFLFNPTGAATSVSPQQTASSPVSPGQSWQVSLSSRQLTILGTVLFSGLCVLVLILTFVYLKVRRRRLEREQAERDERDRKDKHLLEMLESGGPRECELEYPTEDHAGMQNFFTQSSGMTKLPQMTRISHVSSSDVLLQIDGMKRSVPLVQEGVTVLEEFIIAKKSKERSSFRKPGSVYLWTKNEVVSRPNIKRAGHARIFLDIGERFMIEDLGSMNGTWIGEQKIDGAVPLQDGDAIYIGGLEGIRIVYKEGRQEFKQVEQAMICR
jgi:VWFA-related protein